MDTAEGIRVLHVDDDPAFLELAATYLQRDFPEFDVISVESPSEALDRVESVDCVVSDYDMPGSSGLDLLRTVRGRHPELPFVLFTGKGSEEVAAEAIAAGVDGYVQKGGSEKFDLLGNGIRNAVTARRVEEDRRERTKELSLLHRATLILFDDGDLPEKLRELVYAIPGGFQHPDHTAARITVDGETYATPNFAETERTASVTARRNGETLATIEVAYVEPWDRTESPFLDEERELLDSLANMLAAHLERADLISRLSRSNEQFEALIDNLPAVVYLKDTDGRYLLVNDEFEERVGMDREEVVGRKATEIHDDEWGETIREHDRLALERGEPTEFEETRTWDGTAVTYLSVRVPLFGESGEPYAVYGISTDITEHVELIEEHDRILNRMTDAFYALDADWRFTYLNDTAETLLARDEEELLGEVVWEEFPEAVEGPFRDQYERAMETQETVEFRAAYDPLDAVFEVTAYPSESGLSVYFRDVSSEQDRKPELEQYRMMVETVGDPMYVLDTEGVITMANAAMADYLGQPREEIVGTHVSEYIPEADVERGRELIAGLREDDDRRWDAFEMRVRTDEGERVTENKFGLVTDAGKYLGVVGVVRDVSERKAYERKLEQQNRRLEEFASVVSHDLRNPLNVAEGYTDIAREECDSEALEKVQNAHRRMHDLIEDLLVLAREGAGVTDLEPVRIGDLAHECWGTVLTGDATLDVRAEGVIRADRSRLRQLLENLMRNAVEHGGDEVTVTVGDLPDGLYVEDDGVGIAAEDRDRVFDVGYTKSSDGTGFGLSIVKGIAEAHDWDVHVMEGSEGGARFEITGVEFVNESAGS